MKITSHAFDHNTFIPSKYSCEGININPPLKFSDIPLEAKTLLLIVEDPDAPSGTWTHWTIWNINPRTTEINENDHPRESVEGMTSFGRIGYGGPCPPSGTHRYFFKLYALDKTLDLKSNSSVRDIEKAIEGHIIENTELIGLYKKIKN